MAILVIKGETFIVPGDDWDVLQFLKKMENKNGKLNDDILSIIFSDLFIRAVAKELKYESSKSEEDIWTVLKERLKKQQQ